MIDDIVNSFHVLGFGFWVSGFLLKLRVFIHDK